MWRARETDSVLLPCSVNMNCTQPTDSFITGERGGEGRRDTEGTKRNVQKMEREGGGKKRAVGGIGSEMERKDERKESVLGEMSGRTR